MWSAHLTKDKYASNPQFIGSYKKDQLDNYLIQELNKPQDTDKLEELSK